MQITKAEFKCSSERISQVPKDDLKDIAFIGRSNVGKSSLINMLTGHGGLAKVSGTPGKTRLVNHFRINDAWYLVDLPGYGYAKVSGAERERWDQLINRYFEGGRRCALVLQLLDSRHAPSADDIQMLEYLQWHGIPFAAVLTKADKLRKAAQEQAVQDFTRICAPYGCTAVILTSAEKGQGIDQLRGLLDTAQEALENGV